MLSVDEVVLRTSVRGSESSMSVSFGEEIKPSVPFESDK